MPGPNSADCPAAPVSERTRADQCPGALALHTAVDGNLARIRLPGGSISSDQLRALTHAATALGDGRLELTSRGNVQLRALRPESASDLAVRVGEAGLLPAPEHERVRNILASPLTGLDRNGRADVSTLVGRLDRALCADPRLAELPGRFLIALDDGRGDLHALDADIGLTVLDEGTAVLEPGGLVIALGDAVAVILCVAHAFLDEQAAQAGQTPTRAWRIRELVDGPERVARRAVTALGTTAIGVSGGAPSTPRSAPPDLGTLSQRDGGHAIVLAAPLGRLTGDQADLLANLAGARGLRITPWRSVIVADVADAPSGLRRAASVGLGIDAGSPWRGVTSCAGRPGCAKALADVQSDAQAVALATASAGGSAVHWSGCERRCGRPTDTAVDVLATPSGYLVNDASGRTHRVAAQTDEARTVLATLVARLRGAPGRH